MHVQIYVRFKVAATRVLLASVKANVWVHVVSTIRASIPTDFCRCESCKGQFLRCLSQVFKSLCARDFQLPQYSNILPISKQSNWDLIFGDECYEMCGNYV